MNRYSKFGKFTLLLNLFVFMAGVLFIILYVNGEEVFGLVSIVAGITLILTGCISAVSFVLGNSRLPEGEKRSMWNVLPVVGSILFGVVLVAASGFFADAISYVFAALLIVGAVYKFWVLLAVRKRIRYPKWIYAIPAIILTCGVVLFAIGINEVQKVLSLIVGIAFIIYAVNSLFEYIAYRQCFDKHGYPRQSNKVIDIK